MGHDWETSHVNVSEKPPALSTLARFIRISLCSEEEREGTTLEVCCLEASKGFKQQPLLKYNGQEVLESFKPFGVTLEGAQGEHPPGVGWGCHGCGSSATLQSRCGRGHVEVGKPGEHRGSRLMRLL